MKVALLFLLFGLTLYAQTNVDVSKIYGKIQFVDSFPDYKVEVVHAFEDLRVQKVNAFPDKVGKWQIVTSFPDFKIKR